MKPFKEQLESIMSEHGGSYAARNVDAHIAGYEWAYNFFEEERSKQLVVDWLRLIARGPAPKPNTRSDEYYEEGFIALGNNEVFVDGGAFTGDTAEDFIRRMGKNKNYHVHAFEPNTGSYRKAMSRLAAYANVTLVNKGLWSHDTELVFTEGDYDKMSSSFVLNENRGRTKYSVPVTSIDSYFGNIAEGGQPTFIKLDIQGAEREALLGAAATIKRHKPKLAVCTYHKAEDIYVLPRTLHEIRNDYKYALRQHGYAWYNTVLYAV